MVRGSYGTLKNTWQIISKGMYSSDVSKPLNLFDPSNAGGHNVSIKDDYLESNIIMNCMHHQFSFRKDNSFLKRVRFLVAHNKRTVRCSAIFDCFHRMNPIMAKVGKRKQGSVDVLANWSSSRYIWSGHWLARLNALTTEEIADYTDIILIARCPISWIMINWKLAVLIFYRNNVLFIGIIWRFIIANIITVECEMRNAECGMLLCRLSQKKKKKKHRSTRNLITLVPGANGGGTTVRVSCTRTLCFCVYICVSLCIYTYTFKLSTAFKPSYAIKNRKRLEWPQ